tara:strand:+ start:2066 stop:2251 length:186 start_codon:yes stop_codon:yes gene_type:complete
MQIESNTDALASTILVQNEYIGELWSMLYYLQEYQFGLLDEALDDEMLEKLNKLVEKGKGR